MRTEVREVKVTDKLTKSKKVVATVEVPIYENLQELIDNEPEDKIVNLFNKQNIINIQAAERQKHTSNKKLGKKKYLEVAYSTLTHEELVEHAGNYDDLMNFLQSDEIKARVEAKLAEETA